MSTVARKIVLRPVRLHDLDALQRLHDQLVATEDNPFTELIDNHTLVAIELKRFRQSLLAGERYVCFVATDGDAVVGYCAGVIEQAPALFALQHYGSLSEVFVEPSHRRQGVGRGLVRAVLEAFAARGVTRVEATATRAQPAGEALLEALGFAPNSVQLAIDLAAEPGPEPTSSVPTEAHDPDPA